MSTRRIINRVVRGQDSPIPGSSLSVHRSIAVSMDTLVSIEVVSAEAAATVATTI